VASQDDQRQTSQTNQFPVWLRRLSTAKVAQRPSSIAEHADLVVFAEEAQQRPESTLLEDIVPTLRTITCDITQCPHSLLADIQYRGRKEFDKFGYCISLDDHLSVFLSAGCDICQSPGSLKLSKESSEWKGEKVGDALEAWSVLPARTGRSEGQHYIR
jgi:hypothetical protein